MTVSFACEFLDAAHEGELVEGTGEVIREGRLLTFLRGMLNTPQAAAVQFLKSHQTGEA